MATLFLRDLVGRWSSNSAALEAPGKHRLPLTDCAVGLCLSSSYPAGSPPYWLSWDVQASTIELMGTTPASSDVLLRFRLTKNSLCTVQAVNIMQNAGSQPLIRMCVAAGWDGDGILSGELKAGSLQYDANILFRFQTRHHSWNPDLYMRLVEMLRDSHGIAESRHASTTRARASPMALMGSAISTETSTDHAPPPHDALTSSSGADSDQSSVSSSSSGLGVTDTQSPDTVLVYPWWQRGAVNITTSDYNRLGPEQYVNDVLVEFAIRLFYNDICDLRPTLPAQIYVMSSFFYTKFHNEGYTSVQNWTRRFDLFDRQYILIPINEFEHWYLAIIYLPSLALSNAIMAQNNDLASPKGRYSKLPLTHIDDVGGAIVAGHCGEGSRPASNVPDTQETIETDFETEHRLTHPFIESHSGPLSPSRSSSKDALRHSNALSTGNQEFKFKEDRTHVFILDSLALSHTKTIELLCDYVQMEAVDKKGLNTGHTVQPVGVHLKVPTQTNFYDCGLYLVHFARLFMTNPDVAIASMQNNTLRELWGSDTHTFLNMREELTSRIVALSLQWTRVAKGPL